MSTPEKETSDSYLEPEDSGKIGLVVDGRYQINKLLGRGGMGTVYRAEHVGIGRTVAVKLLHPTLAHVPEIAKRFEREALAIGRIEHPNCVDVSDSGKLDDGSLFLVMEYLEGQSAGDLMADTGRIAPERALHIMKHVLRGLAHAHDADIIHRDIKPENIFVVDQDGDPDFAKILDFGIAKLIGSAEKDEVKLTQAGVAFGTPVYMSPEQAVGTPVDGRADLYCTTVVLYEMLTGKPPFYSDDKIEVLSMHTSRPPPPFEDVAPGAGIPAVVEKLVHRGLAKRPDERFSSAAEYIDAIDECLEALEHGGPVYTAARMPKRASTAPVVYEEPRSQQRATTELVAPPKESRRGLVLGLAALVAAVAIGITIVLLGGGSKDEKTKAKEVSAAIAKSVAQQAAESLAAEDPEKALSLLEDQLDAIADDAEAQMQLGHAYTASSRPRDALRAYERAITLDDKMLADPALRTNLQALLTARDANIALDAADVLLSRLQDDVAAKHLVDLASRSKGRAARNRARELAEKHDLLEQIDWVESYTLDLTQGTKCVDRKKVVEQLRALGDPRAIPALKKARFRRSKSKKRKYRRTNINGCLKKAANRAIKELQKKAASMPKPDPAAKASSPAKPTP